MAPGGQTAQELKEKLRMMKMKAKSAAPPPPTSTKSAEISIEKLNENPTVSKNISDVAPKAKASLPKKRSRDDNVHQNDGRLRPPPVLQQNEPPLLPDSKKRAKSTSEIISEPIVQSPGQQIESSAAIEDKQFAKTAKPLPKAFSKSENPGKPSKIGTSQDQEPSTQLNEAAIAAASSIEAVQSQVSKDIPQTAPQPVPQPKKSVQQNVSGVNRAQPPPPPPPPPPSTREEDAPSLSEPPEKTNLPPLPVPGANSGIPKKTLPSFLMAPPADIISKKPSALTPQTVHAPSILQSFANNAANNMDTTETTRDASSETAGEPDILMDGSVSGRQLNVSPTSSGTGINSRNTTSKKLNTSIDSQQQVDNITSANDAFEDMPPTRDSSNSANVHKTSNENCIHPSLPSNNDNNNTTQRRSTTNRKSAIGSSSPDCIPELNPLLTCQVLQANPPLVSLCDPTKVSHETFMNFLARAERAIATRETQKSLEESLLSLLKDIEDMPKLIQRSAEGATIDVIMDGYEGQVHNFPSASQTVGALHTELGTAGDVPV